MDADDPPPNTCIPTPPKARVIAAPTHLYLNNNQLTTLDGLQALRSLKCGASHPNSGLVLKAAPFSSPNWAKFGLKRVPRANFRSQFTFFFA